MKSSRLKSEMMNVAILQRCAYWEAAEKHRGTDHQRTAAQYGGLRLQASRRVQHLMSPEADENRRFVQPAFSHKEGKTLLISGKRHRSCHHEDQTSQ